MEDSSESPLLILTESDVQCAASSISTHGLLSLAARAYVRLSSRMGFALPPRSSTHSENRVTLYMPAYIEHLGTSVKIVSVPHEQKSSGGVPASTIVLDEFTGGVKAVVNARNLTALRTAAGSLLATRILGPAQPRTLVAFGSGKQIEAHIELYLSAYPSITRYVVVNRSLNDRFITLIKRFRNKRKNIQFVWSTLSGPVFDLDPSDPLPLTLQQLVGLADIICTATSATTPLFHSAWVKAGTHINLVGSFTPEMHEVDSDLIKRAEKVVVDSRQACTAEAGELIDTGLSGEDVMELGEILDVGNDGELLPSQEKIQCAKRGDITIFKQVGIGLLDLAIAKVVMDVAESMKLGTRIGSYDTH